MSLTLAGAAAAIVAARAACLPATTMTADSCGGRGRSRAHPPRPPRAVEARNTYDNFSSASGVAVTRARSGICRLSPRFADGRTRDEGGDTFAIVWAAEPPELGRGVAFVGRSATFIYLCASFDPDGAARRNGGNPRLRRL